GEFSFVIKLSGDGRTMLVTDESRAEGMSYGVYLAHTDGSPPVRLGDGSASDLSADGKWVLAVVPEAGRPRLFLYPNGPGARRELPVDRSFTFRNAYFFPDCR